MSILQARGGIPVTIRETIDTTGRRLEFRSKHNPQGHVRIISAYLIVRVATAPLKIYWTERDFDDDTNYVLVPIAAAATPHGEWEGPVEAAEIWVRGSGGSSDMELTAFQRRG